MSGAEAPGEKADALERLAALRLATERLYDEFAATAVRRRPVPLRRLLLALELRWKLEEQVVIPALRDGESAEMLRAAERESSLLRELTAVARAGSLAPAPEHAFMSALEGIAALRSERIEHALLRAQRRAHVDPISLRREMDELLERWHKEVLSSGDIEDEEIDPVGLPPR